MKAPVSWLLAVTALIMTVGCADSPLELAVKESNVEQVRAGIAAAVAGKQDISPAIEYALWQLSPSKPETTEILKLLFASLGKDNRAVLARTPVAANRGTKARILYISPVEVAARRSSPDGVRVLLDNGLIAASDAAQNALVDAVANGSDGIVTMLLDAGTAVNFTTRNNDTPLAMARRVNNQSTIALLLARGARD